MTKDSYLVEGVDLGPLVKARDFLDYAIQNTKDELDRAGAIQAFEFCYELSWKSMRKILIATGVAEEKLAANPKHTFRIAAENFLIQDPEKWFVFIIKRNLTVHTYNIEIAKEVFEVLPTFLRELNLFLVNVFNGNANTNQK